MVRLSVHGLTGQRAAGKPHAGAASATDRNRVDKTGIF